jgi:phosphate:Na+ symporter
MTVVVQSSSATIAVLQNFASTAGPDGVSRILGLEGAIPILFGDNIGTTITALLACIGQSKNAQRTALSHSIFNISGSLLFIWFIPQFAAFVQMISPSGAEIDVISRQIANAHTTFNITNTLIWTPLLPLMVKIVTTLIPDTAEDFAMPKNELRYIKDGLQDQPEFAMHLVMQEISGVNERVSEMLLNTRRTVLYDDMEANTNVLAMENDLDEVQDKLVRYMSSLFTTGYMNELQSVRLAGLMEVSSNVERISDSCASIAHKIKSKVEKQQSFSNMALEELSESFELVESMVDKVTDVLKNNDAKAAVEVLTQSTSGEVKSMYASVGTLADAARRTLAECALVGWQSGGHSDAAVPVLAIGAGSELFSGFMENTDVPRRIAKAAGWKIK